jgi:hypothetical protein
VNLAVMMLKVDGGFNKFHSHVYSRMMNELKESEKVLAAFVRGLLNT